MCICLNAGLGLHPHPFSEYASTEDSGKFAHLHRLALLVNAISKEIHKYQNAPDIFLLLKFGPACSNVSVFINIPTISVLIVGMVKH